MTKKQAPDIGQAFVDGLNRGVLQDTSMLNPYIRKAIRFSLKTHEVYQKQKRKGKDIPYITHVLTVGLILARAGAPEHIIVAGILHDTIEDSSAKKKVTREMLIDRFGSPVADIVQDVTEPNKNLPWRRRKQEALEHIKTLDGPSLWVKSADVISNVSEILDDYEHDGETVFSRFNAPREEIIANYRAVITALITSWNTKPLSGKNPLISDLKTLADDLESLAAGRNGAVEESEIDPMSSADRWSSIIEKLEKECPLIPHVRASRLFSTVRRMKAEKELGIPINRRNSFAISVRTGTPANQMTEREWEKFYGQLCNELEADYPDIFEKLFSGNEDAKGKKAN